VDTQPEARSSRLWETVAWVAGFLVAVLLLDLLGWALEPVLSRFRTASGIVEVVFGGFGLLILCGAWVVGTWIVARLMRSVLHIDAAPFG